MALSPLHLHPSHLAATTLSAIHGLAVVAILICPITLITKALLLGLLAFSVARGLRTHAWRFGRAVVTVLTLREDGDVELEYGDGRRIVTRVDASSTVLHWLMALRLRHQGRRLSLLLLPDMLEAESWRRLTVLLRSSKADS